MDKHTYVYISGHGPGKIDTNFGDGCYLVRLDEGIGMFSGALIRVLERDISLLPNPALRTSPDPQPSLDNKTDSKAHLPGNNKMRGRGRNKIL